MGNLKNRAIPEGELITSDLLVAYKIGANYPYLYYFVSLISPLPICLGIQAVSNDFSHSTNNQGPQKCPAGLSLHDTNLIK